MKKIIGLYGRHDSGKSCCLKHLIDVLLASGAREVKRDSCASGLEDWRVCLEYAGIRIAVTTGGDDATIVKTNLFFAVELKCEIVVTATRTRGETCLAVEDFRAAGSACVEVLWIAKQYSEPARQDSANRNQAIEIKAVIDTILQQGL